MKLKIKKLAILISIILAIVGEKIKISLGMKILLRTMIIFDVALIIENPSYTDRHHKQSMIRELKNTVKIYLEDKSSKEWMLYI